MIKPRSHYSPLLDLPGEGDDLLEWDEPAVFVPPPLVSDPHRMLTEVRQLKEQGRDPVSDRYKPLRQDLPASADFEYYHTHWLKRNDPVMLLCMQTALGRMRANAYHVTLPNSQSNPLDGSVLWASPSGRFIKTIQTGTLNASEGRYPIWTVWFDREEGRVLSRS